MQPGYSTTPVRASRHKAMTATATSAPPNAPPRQHSGIIIASQPSKGLPATEPMPPATKPTPAVTATHRLPARAVKPPTIRPVTAQGIAATGAYSIRDSAVIGRSTARPPSRVTSILGPNASVSPAHHSIPTNQPTSRPRTNGFRHHLARDWLIGLLSVLRTAPPHPPRSSARARGRSSRRGRGSRGRCRVRSSPNRCSPPP